MKVLLTALNSKYIHTNLAVRYLKEYAAQYGYGCEIAEYTINQHLPDILEEVYRRSPDVLLLSCYIWNIGMMMELAEEYRRICPQTIILAGGPEVSYNSAQLLQEQPALDGVLCGEGETAFLEYLRFLNGELPIEQVHSLCWRDKNGTIQSNPAAELMDMAQLPFPYPDIDQLSGRILYFESIRGCPFRCSYCLSSVAGRVRYLPLELTFQRLQRFLDARVQQVKFVDRTFNCKKDHAMAIWKFIAEHDNGVTNFHFEIAADLITEEELELLNTLRPGLVQLEIGVQSTNPQTIKAIHRKMDFGRVTEIVNRIAKGRNIHQHLDLIAGLPYEDYDSFRRSFADVYALRPQQLQLGFLKVLRGSFMYEHTEEYDCHYQEREPYEVLYTKWLPYDDVLKLKDVEEMVEVYYNSGQFVHTLPMIERLYENPFDFFQELGDFYRAKGYSEAAHNRIQRYEILLEFLQDEKQQDEAFFRQMMVLDLYARENMKTRPRFAKDPSEWKNESRDFYQKEAETRTLLPSYTTYDWKQLQRMTHVEVFDYDVLGNGEKARTVLLFDYQKRDPLTGNAEMIDCSELFYA